MFETPVMSQMVTRVNCRKLAFCILFVASWLLACRSSFRQFLTCLLHRPYAPVLPHPDLASPLGHYCVARWPTSDTDRGEQRACYLWGLGYGGPMSKLFAGSYSIGVTMFVDVLMNAFGLIACVLIMAFFCAFLLFELWGW